jgi:hypothetical protein
MNVFRNINLQRLFSTLVLFAALFSQIQTLYACDSMESKPKMVCCCGDHDSAICPMADNCGVHELSDDNACCELSYDILNDTGMMNSVATVDYLTLLLDGPQPPPIVDFQKYSATPLPISSRILLASPEPLAFNLDNPTYLLTRRLRL